MRAPPKAPELLRLEDQLCFALYAASRAMTRAYQPLLGPLGLTYPQYLVMMVLWAEGNASVRALGERLGLDSGTLTPLLKRLQSGGLVRRTRDAQDQRVVNIRLTPKGVALRARAKGVPVELLCRAGFPLQGSGLASLGRLRRALVALTKRLDDSDSPTHP